MLTEVYNIEEFDYDSLELFFGFIVGVKYNKLHGAEKVSKPLKIERVVIRRNNTIVEKSSWTKLGIFEARKSINADIDIYLTDGRYIQANSSDGALLQKLFKYVQEFDKRLYKTRRNKR